MVSVRRHLYAIVLFASFICLCAALPMLAMSYLMPYNPWYSNGQNCFHLHHGIASFGHLTARQLSTTYGPTTSDGNVVTDTITISTSTTYEAYLSIYLWPVLLASSVLPFISAPAALKRRRERWRVMSGCCGVCGYNLTGNCSGICPECGHQSKERQVDFRAESLSLGASSVLKRTP